MYVGRYTFFFYSVLRIQLLDLIMAFRRFMQIED